MSWGTKGEKFSRVIFYCSTNLCCGIVAENVPLPVQLFFVCSPRPLLTVEGFGSLEPLQFNSMFRSPVNWTSTSLNLILFAVDFVMKLL